MKYACSQMNTYVFNFTLFLSMSSRGTTEAQLVWNPTAGSSNNVEASLGEFSNSAQAPTHSLMMHLTLFTLQLTGTKQKQEN